MSIEITEEELMRMEQAESNKELSSVLRQLVFALNNKKEQIISLDPYLEKLNAIVQKLQGLSQIKINVPASSVNMDTRELVEMCKMVRDATIDLKESVNQLTNIINEKADVDFKMIPTRNNSGIIEYITIKKQYAAQRGIEGQ